MQAPAERPQLFTTRAIFMLLAPLFLNQLLGISVGFIGTIMVARAGDIAVSAVSLVDSVNFLIIEVFSALATGGAVIAAQYIGRGEKHNANDAARQLLYSSLLISLLLMALSLALCRPLLGAIFGGVTDEVMDNMVRFFILSAISYPFLALYNAGAALMRAVGNNKTPLYLSIGINVISLITNVITIYFLNWGVSGAGTAALLARASGALAIIAILQRRDGRISVFPVFKIELKLDMIKRILKIGIPTGLDSGIFQGGKLLVSGLVSTLGTAATAANGIANTLTSVANLPGGAAAMCMVTVVGQCMGAGEPDQADRNAKKVLGIAHGGLMVTNLLTLLFLRQLLGVFNLSPEATELAERVMWLFSLTSFVLWPASFTLPNALRAAGDAKTTMYIAIVSVIVLRVGLSYLLAGPFGMGLMGVWLAMILDWVGRGAFFMLRFFRGRWKKIEVI